MEGSRFIPDQGALRRPIYICRECGQFFAPHQLAEGMEELCPSCYEDLFAQRIEFASDVRPAEHVHHHAARHGHKPSLTIPA